MDTLRICSATSQAFQNLLEHLVQTGPLQRQIGPQSHILNLPKPGSLSFSILDCLFPVSKVTTKPKNPENGGAGSSFGSPGVSRMRIATFGGPRHVSSNLITGDGGV